MAAMTAHDKMPSTLNTVRIGKWRVWIGIVISYLVISWISFVVFTYLDAHSWLLKREYLFAIMAVCQKGTMPSMLATKQNKKYKSTNATKVYQSSGRTSVSGRQTVPVLRSACSRRMTTHG